MKTKSERFENSVSERDTGALEEVVRHLLQAQRACEVLELPDARRDVLAREVCAYLDQLKELNLKAAQVLEEEFEELF